MATHTNLRLFDVDGMKPVKRTGLARLPSARDKSGSIQVREFNGWTLDKLEVLSSYFRMYRRVAGGGSYIDAFAGEGHAIIDGEQVLGSPLRAATSGAFRSLYLFENDQRCHDRLSTAINQLPSRLAARCHVQERSDCNETIPKLLASGVVDKDRPCFAFLDPNSTELSWETVAELSRYKTYSAPPDGNRTPVCCRVELWILLNTHQALNRLLPADRVKHRVPPHAGKLDFVMGGRAAWWDIWQSPTATMQTLANRYSERLQTSLGYSWSHPQMVLDRTTKRPVYYMVHASDHPNAHTIMRSAKKGRMVDERRLPGI